MCLARFAAPLTVAALAFTVPFTAAPDTVQAQTTAQPAISDDAFKLRRLNHHFEFIRSEAEFGRKLSGGLSLGFGIPLAGIGAYLLTQDCDGGSCPPVGFAFALSGAVLTASGVFILAFPGQEETATVRFIKHAPDPDSDPSLLREAVLDGERLLEDLATSGRNMRFIVGSVYAVLGALQLTGFPYRDDPYTQQDLSSTLTGGGLWLVLAAISFAITSDAEDARDAYHDEVKRGISSATNAPKLRLVPSPVPQGGGLAASLTW